MYLKKKKWGILLLDKLKKPFSNTERLLLFCSLCWARTSDPLINSQML